MMDGVQQKLVSQGIDFDFDNLPNEVHNEESFNI